MKKIIKGNSFKYLTSALGFWGHSIGSVKQNVHDGDTLKVYDEGHISIRFLGIDTPEISFEIKGIGQFIYTNNPKWNDYLSGVEQHWPEIQDDLGIELYEHIMRKIRGRNAALNQHTYASLAESHLEYLIAEEMEKQDKNEEDFRFFLPLSYEMFDAYGRLLAFVHPDDKKNRPGSFNMQLLKDGMALPYFIWPNINPFRKKSSLVEAVFDSPSKFRKYVNGDKSLQQARKDVKKARDKRLGIYDNNGKEPLLLESFELRFLGRKSPPSRAFLSLEKDNNVIYAADQYFKHFPEDRLFIPDHFVPLFESKGWQKQ